MGKQRAKDPIRPWSLSRARACRVWRRGAAVLACVAGACGAAIIAGSPVQASAAISDLVVREARAQQIPPALALAVVRLESGFRPAVVHRGNYGLMQIRLGTARGLGYAGSAEGLLDSATNLRFGMRYLAQAYRLAKGDLCGTIMRYQSGLGARRPNAANRAYCARARALIARAGG